MQNSLMKFQKELYQTEIEKEGDELRIEPQQFWEARERFIDKHSIAADIDAFESDLYDLTNQCSELSFNVGVIACIEQFIKLDDADKLLFLAKLRELQQAE